MARLLSVVWYQVLPARFGGQKGIAEFNQYLAEYHELYCLCSKNNIPAGDEKYPVMPLLPVGRMQVIYPPAWVIIFKNIRRLKITHLILEHSYYGLAGILLKRMTGLKLIVHAHNIEAMRFRSLGKRWWPFLWVLEKLTHRHADLNLFKTSEDLEFARIRFGLKSGKCMVVPFGISRKHIPVQDEKNKAREEIRQKHGIRKDEKILLFSGSLDYSPNAQALRTLIETVIPQLQSKTSLPFRLIACGRIILPEFNELRALSHPAYIYAGMVENIDTYMLAADLFLNPVVEGGGIKVKLMEALAFNLTVVSTIHGAIGVDTAHTGQKLFTAADHDWDGFCDRIINAWDNLASTPASFFETYHWSRVIRPVAEKIESL
jgi:glycosyltransferase involved in cell wall biosynthesis